MSNIWQFSSMFNSETITKQWIPYVGFYDNIDIKYYNRLCSIMYWLFLSKILPLSLITTAGFSVNIELFVELRPAWKRTWIIWVKYAFNWKSIRHFMYKTLSQQHIELQHHFLWMQSMSSALKSHYFKRVCQSNPDTYQFGMWNQISNLHIYCY